ncbi:hypothetical protein RSW15_24315, partial [Escherichia coli]|uniref:hypothetical protein n=1 Tax=Escherichia coli TaxID=562 RepID=UPI0028DFD85A
GDPRDEAHNNRQPVQRTGIVERAMATEDGLTPAIPYGHASKHPIVHGKVDVRVSPSFGSRLATARTGV